MEHGRTHCITAERPFAGACDGSLTVGRVSSSEKPRLQSFGLPLSHRGRGAHFPVPNLALISIPHLLLAVLPTTPIYSHPPNLEPSPATSSNSTAMATPISPPQEPGGSTPSNMMEYRPRSLSIASPPPCSGKATLDDEADVGAALALRGGGVCRWIWCCPCFDVRILARTPRQFC